MQGEGSNRRDLLKTTNQTLKLEHLLYQWIPVKCWAKQKVTWKRVRQQGKVLDSTDTFTGSDNWISFLYFISYYLTK